jgi:hypothetical protein
MLRKLVAIAIIWAGASIAWAVLAQTLVQRTAESDNDQRAALERLGGSPQTQEVPTFFYDVPIAPPRGPRIHLPPSVRTTGAAPASSQIRVDLDLDQREKGLLWYSTYAVAFESAYTVRNSGPAATLRVSMPLAAQGATFDGVRVEIGGTQLPAVTQGGVVSASMPVASHATTIVRFAYRSHGAGTWAYRFGSDSTDIRDFDLVMNTNFRAIDFPAHTLAPTAEQQTPRGWVLTWSYRNLISGNGIGMTFPERLQPGPLAERITGWAPVALLFYFFVLVVVTVLRNIDLHPVNYFFIAAAFFAFHLLFAYTIDRMPLGSAFALASAVSLFLTISYLRLVVGVRFAAVEAGLAQFFYLILFSLALFNEGTSGLSITIGAIVTLFLCMQWTGRIRWSERFANATAVP